MEQISKETALSIYSMGVWKEMTDTEKVRLQLYQDRLCMPWQEFIGSLSRVLGRSVWTHEFAGNEGQKRLQEEFEGIRPNPSFQDIFNQLRTLVPEDKIIMVERH